jgi:membrane-bound lytic murein transglycosylase D
VQGKKLVLPSGSWDDFVLWQDSIIISGDSSLFQVMVQKVEYPPEPGRHFVNEPVKDLEIDGKTKIQYRVKTGDVLGVIAEKYDVSVSDLKYWNNISDERRIQAGQNLDIFVPEMDVAFYSGLDKQTSEKSTAKPAEIISQIQKTPASILEQFDLSRKIEHVVKNGESPFTIAKKYEGVTPELILEWNQIDDPRKIQVGQKLTVYLKR